MDQEKWRIRTEEAMASMERMRQHPVSYEELVLNQYRNDKKAGRKNDFLLKSKKAREILAQWIDGNDNVSHEGRTLPGDAELENSSREADGGVKEDTSGTRELGGDRRADSSGVLISRADKSEQERLIRENAKEKRQMEKKYYAVKGSPLSLSLAEHEGNLTQSDIKENLKKAIRLSNEYGEDWIADLNECWYQRSGMILPTEDEELLEREDVMDYQIGEMLDPWSSGYRTEMLLKMAGKGKKLEPLDEDQKLELEDEADSWTLRTIITEHLPYEEPMY